MAPTVLVGNPATVRYPGARDIAKDVSAAAFPGAFGLARSTLPARKLPGMDRNVVLGNGRDGSAEETNRGL
jgi:hypothetical protein